MRVYPVPLSLGSSTSRRELPNRFQANTTMAMARPGNTPSQRGQVHVSLCRPVQHAAPGRHVRRHTDAQETQCRLGNDRDAQKRRDNYNVECQAVGNHIAENDARVAGADRLGRQDIVHLFDGERLGTQDPGSTWG